MANDRSYGVAVLDWGNHIALQRSSTGILRSYSDGSFMALPRGTGVQTHQDDAPLHGMEDEDEEDPDKQSSGEAPPEDASEETIEDAYIAFPEHLFFEDPLRRRKRSKLVLLAIILLITSIPLWQVVSLFGGVSAVRLIWLPLW